MKPGDSRRHLFLKTQIKRFLLLSLVEGVCRFAICQSVPNLVNYQGRLTDQTGAPLAPGAYSIQFRLWDSPSAAGGKLVWGEQQTVTVISNGVFNVILGSSNGSLQGVNPQVPDLGSAFTSSNRFLGLTIVSNGGGPIANASEILPRQQLLSSPFAMTAQFSAQAQVASSLIPTYQNALCPPGTIVAFAGDNVPIGWLLCDGAYKNSTTFPLLFKAISTNWGTGDLTLGGTNDFGLPDLRGLFLRGVNGSRADSYADPDVPQRAVATGDSSRANAVGSLQPDVFAKHSHKWFTSSAASYGGNSQMAVNGGSGATWFEYDTDRNASGPVPQPGGNETRPKNAYVNYIIKY